MRPLDPRRPLHLVLRSSRARGSWSLHVHERRTRELVHRLARKFGVRVYRFANSGNHLHLLVKAPTREASQNYLRALAGMLARAVTGARKGRPIVGKFWDHLAFSRVVAWGKDFTRTRRYVITNEIEAAGMGDLGGRKSAARAKNRRNPLPLRP
jgi:REP element-mobilizing transposase RayT